MHAMQPYVQAGAPVEVIHKGIIPLSHLIHARWVIGKLSLKDCKPLQTTNSKLRYFIHAAYACMHMYVRLLYSDTHAIVSVCPPVAQVATTCRGNSMPGRRQAKAMRCTGDAQAMEW